jgi:hypothetical protein
VLPGCVPHKHLLPISPKKLNGHCAPVHYLATNDVKLPDFSDCSKINPVFNLRQLDDYLRLKSAPRDLQLLIALLSTMDFLANSWLISISHTLTCYEGFRSVFKRHFWSGESQSLASCSMYRDKYSKQSGDRISAHFL